MPLDAICLTAVKNELSRQIIGMKIEKIQQPERDIIILSLRGQGVRSLRLLISVGASDARVHLTEYKFENPKSPPMFCMLLRKHISGARVKKITQPVGERVLTLHLETIDSIGVKSDKSLVVEMIGRMSTMVLIDNDRVIIDCLRRIGGEINGKRSVLPGLIYRDPPKQEGKLNPLDFSEDDLCKLLKNKGSLTIEKLLISNFIALSPLICREIVWRAYGDTDYRLDAIKDNGHALCKEFLDLMSKVKINAQEPWLLLSKDNTVYDFSYTQIKQYDNCYIAKREESFSTMIDTFFTRTEQKRRIDQRSSATLKSMSIARDRLVRKMTVQRTELEETAKRDHLRESGDLITANMHKIKKGDLVLTTEDFYSEDKKLRKIKLDPMKSPQQNAAKYYKAYKKAKNARKFITEQIQNGEKELEYLESVIEMIKRVETENDLEDIRKELVSTGYIKKKQQQKVKQTESAPLRFKSSKGLWIFVGRNNMQNDKLTLKTALKTDIWLHTQKIHGAHVIISCNGKSPDEATLNEAASIAAFYSAARRDSKVPVDYTEVRRVKKPSGGRPGMVIYNDFKTILASPDEELVRRLRDNG